MYVCGRTEACFMVVNLHFREGNIQCVFVCVCVCVCVCVSVCVHKHTPALVHFGALSYSIRPGSKREGGKVKETFDIVPQPWLCGFCLLFTCL